jgi:hypothetical protein
MTNAYVLLRRGSDGGGEVQVLTPASGGVPRDADLRLRAAELARSKFGAAPGALELEQVDGPQARGWMISRAVGSGLGAVIAARVGDEVALVAVVQHSEDVEGARRELRDWIRSARVAAPGERRAP